ncbi:cytochrome-c oxidase, subunit VIIa [Teratosphaeria destructans]|uniref:Cytochrome-c oxidase, subunit VIIa n=1 Tax=Teratosphaeria destructans TaxID=418781 RepID=A0A9W7W4J0_9PEZI|nr:cytochrome-c oxidase, subunit VIIa [Teratosphaeria destructans]
MVKPITGMLRRGLVLDLSVAFGTIAYTSPSPRGTIGGFGIDMKDRKGLGTSVGYFWWYGYHVPAVRRRDLFYAKLEDQRAAAFGQV